MIPNDQPLRKQTIQRMLNKLIGDLEDDRDFSEWQADFVRSVNEQFDIRGDISSKQAEILERIYDK